MPKDKKKLEPFFIDEKQYRVASKLNLFNF